MPSPWPTPVSRLLGNTAPSGSSRERREPASHRRHRPRQDRPATRGAVRRSRPPGRRCRRQSRDRTHRELRSRPFPGEADLDEHLARLVPAGLLRATTDYADAVPERRRGGRGRAACSSTRPAYRTSARWTRQRSDLRSQPHRGTLVIYETTLPVGTTRRSLEARAGGAAAGWWRAPTSTSPSLPERVLTGRVFADLRKYPKLVGGLSPDGAAAAVDFYEATLEFDDRPDLARANGVWDLGSAEAAEMAKLAETTYRDVNIGLANQFARFAETCGYRRLRGDRGRELAALQPHPPSWHLRRRSLHPGLPPALPVQRPGRHGGQCRPRGERLDAQARGRPPAFACRATCAASASSSSAPRTEAV